MEKNVSIVTQVYEVNVTANDFGRAISCQARQTQPDGSQIFDIFKPTEVLLNVTFAPQPLAKQRDFSCQIGDNLLIFELKDEKGRGEKG